MTEPIKVFIADDHPIVREGLATVVNQEDDLRVIGTAGNKNLDPGYFRHRLVTISKLLGRSFDKPTLSLPKWLRMILRRAQDERETNLASTAHGEPVEPSWCALRQAQDKLVEPYWCVTPAGQPNY